MNIRVVREPSVSRTTLGVVFVDGHFFSFCLEDEIRERAGEPVAAWKVYGQTAIPAGRYRVTLSHSPKFGRVLPELRDVPGFVGIRIHPGNTHAESEGCLLLGVQRSGVRVIESAKACSAFEQLVSAAIGREERVWIDIENPPIPGGSEGEV